jgi:hypothetical protein
LVFDVANTFQDATSFLARATFLYVSRAGFADLGDSRSLALHASENSAACVFTQSLMRPPPGLTSAHFALMSAAQQGVAEADAVRRCALVKPADTLFQESEGHGDMVPNSRGSLQIIAIFKPS